MNPTPDTTTTGNGGSFTPPQAAALLDQASRQARRQFQPSPPGSWRPGRSRFWPPSARSGSRSAASTPPGPDRRRPPGLIAFMILNFAATVTVRPRAFAGVTGWSRLSPAEIPVLAAAGPPAPVLMSSLAVGGDSLAWYPITVPLIVLGLAFAVLTAYAGRLALCPARGSRSPSPAPWACP